MTDQILFRKSISFPNAKLPERKTLRAAGIDLFTAIRVECRPRERILIPTGYQVTLPQGYFGQVVDCSTVALQKGMQVLAGIIDEDYCGQIIILMYNTSNHVVVFATHEKVAQMVIQPFCDYMPREAPKTYERSLISTPNPRNSSGFGVESTESLFSKESKPKPSVCPGFGDSKSCCAGKAKTSSSVGWKIVQQPKQEEDKTNETQSKERTGK
jgi:dUTP pyrophosphatase